MTVSFEPNRLAERVLANTYENVAATVKQATNLRKKNKSTSETKISLDKAGDL